MDSGSIQDLVRQMRAAIEQATDDDKSLAISFKKMHQGYPDHTLQRFLKARDHNVTKATKMLLDCLYWRVNNDVDNILTKSIKTKEMYNAIRESQLIGMTGFCKKGRPVFALGVCAYDKAPIDMYVQSHIQINEYRDRVLFTQQTAKMNSFVGSCIKILDMTGLNLSLLSRLKTFTIISTVDDLNYPEKTDTYYIVNAPYIFSTCWKVVKPLLQERTKRKVRVLQGCGREELLKVMDWDVLPHFCKGEKSSNSSKAGLAPSLDNKANCFSPSHPFHVELWNYIKQEASMISRYVGPAPQKSYHVQVPEPDEEVYMIESALESAMEDLSIEAKSSEGSGHSSYDQRGKAIELC